MDEYIEITKDNWKDYHGMECEFSDLNKCWESGVLVGFNSERDFPFIGSCDSRTTCFICCRIEKPSKYTKEEIDIHNKVINLGWFVKLDRDEYLKCDGFKTDYYRFYYKWYSLEELKKAEIVERIELE